MSNELTITDEKLDLIKRTVAVGATNDELELFLYTCKRTGLDPLARQIYCVKRQGKIVIQTGIDGYRVVADRTGKYAGNDDPVFDNEQKPRRATVTVYKLVEGVRCPFTSTARWDQYYPGKVQGFMWDRMPHLMLGKCAEALSLRKAFPQDLSGLYTHEEMMQADLDKAGRGEARLGAAWKEKARLGPAGEEERGQTALKPEPPVQELPRDGFVENLPWIGVIKEVTTHEGENARGRWTLYRINLEDGQTATTFDEALADDAIVMIGQKVKVLVEPNKRKAGTFTYLGFEPLEPATAQKEELFPKEEEPWT